MPHSLLTELQLQTVKEVVEREVASFLHNLPHFIDRTMREATLTALGLKENHKGLVFTESTDNWLRKYFTECITKFITTDTREYINEILRIALSDDTIRAKILTDLHEIYRETVLSKLRQSIRHRAEQDADNLVDAIGEKLRYTPNQDLNDPESYYGPLGEILLEQIAKNIVDSEPEPEEEAAKTGSIFDDDIPF